MTEKIIFREMLSEIKELADKKGNCLTVEEINEFFSNAHLKEEQLSMIYEYLAGQKIEVQGYEPKGGGEAAAPGSRGDASLTEDACMEMYLADLQGIFRVPDAEEEKLFLLAAKALDTTKKPLNLIALLVQLFIITPRIFAIAFWRNDWYITKFHGQGPCLVPLISPVHQEVKRMVNWTEFL